MSNRRFAALGAVLFAGIVVGCASESPVSPPAPPPPGPPPAPPDTRTSLIDTVRVLAEQRNLDPILPPAPVRSELVELGRALAFDKILSGNRDISCMTCHLPSFATGDGKSLSVGQGGTGLGPSRTHPGGVFIPRNSPPLFNLHLQEQFFWDGRLEELEDGTIRTPAGAQVTPEMEAVFEFGALSAQPLFPVASRDEMRADGGNELAAIPDGDFAGVWSALMTRLGAIAAYRQMFEAAYPGTAFDDMTFAHAANAIAGFLISELAFTDTRWDRFLLGDDDQLSNAQLRGAKSFMLVRCMRCHETDEFDDRNNEFHNIAAPQIGPGKGDGPNGRDDFGRERVTGDPAERRMFRTPQLRNVELTGPWGRAGQFTTLKNIVEHYDRIDERLFQYDVSQLEPALQGTILDNFDEILETRDSVLTVIVLEDGEADDIVAFLEALTDDRARDLDRLAPASVPSGLSIDR
ncbi:MAG: cytochrome c peroxidase [Gemmatimonadota bacterium]|nr:cytochrome c peroxidase [Gemmatimonadota bacterium]